MILIINKSSSSRQSRIGIREISLDWRSDRLRCRFFVGRPRPTPSDSWRPECQFQPLLETSQVQLLQSSYSKSVFYHVVSLFTSSQFSCCIFQRLFGFFALYVLEMPRVRKWNLSPSVITSHLSGVVIFILKEWRIQVIFLANNQP